MKRYTYNIQFPYNFFVSFIQFCEHCILFYFIQYPIQFNSTEFNCRLTDASIYDFDRNKTISPFQQLE